MYNNDNNIFNSIENLYNMNGDSWREVLATMYNNFGSLENAFRELETNFGLRFPEEVKIRIEALIKDGTLGEILNTELLGDINSKVDKFNTELIKLINISISEVNETINTVNSKFDKIVPFSKLALNSANEDNTNIFNSIVNNLKHKIISSKKVADNTISIPSGEYIFLNTIEIPSFIKIKPIGNVTFRFKGNGDFIKIIPYTVDTSDIKSMYLRGSLIDCTNGGLTLIGTEKQGTAIKLGEYNNDSILGRYSLNDIAVTGFNTAIYLITNHNFLGNFDRLHLELNTINLRVGNGDVSKDSGENMTFNHCCFAGSDKCIYFDNDSNATQGYYFNNCSFDFNKLVLEISNNYKYAGDINFNHCHIEANPLIINNLANENYVDFYPPTIKFLNCNFIQPYRQYFTGNRMHIYMDTIRIQSSNETQEIENSFIADNFDKIYIKAKNIEFVNTTGKKGVMFGNTILSYCDFKDKTGDLLRNELGGFIFKSQDGISKALAENGYLNILGNGYIAFETSSYLNVSYGDNIVITSLFKSSDVSLNWRIKAFQYDDENNLIDTYDSLEGRWSGTNSVLKCLTPKYNFIIKNSKIKKVRFRFEIAQLTNVAIQELVINKI